MARVPPPRHDIDRGLRVPDLREGSFFPLTTCCRSSLRANCPSQRLPTPRFRRCGLSVTSPIRLPPCADGSLQSSSPFSRAAHAAERKQRGAHVVICDTVVLVRVSTDSGGGTHLILTCPSEGAGLWCYTRRESICHCHLQVSRTARYRAQRT